MSFFTPLVQFLRSLLVHRSLVFGIVKRDVVARYKGSFLGFSWSLLNPMLLLMVYTFVFSYVFKAKWPSIEMNSHGEYAMILFSGLIVHGLLAEVIAASSPYILSNVNYVKKIVFPLEIVPCIIIGPALYQAVVSFFILLVGILLIKGSLPQTALLLPLVLIPFIPFLIGVSSILAGLGVYLRDIQHISGLLTTILLFVSPIFYSVKMLPSHLQIFVLLNPLTCIIEEVRKVLILGVPPDWFQLFIYFLVSTVFATIALSLFKVTRKGFADVL